MQNTEYICDCGNLFTLEKSFTVYHKKFCSMACLNPYKEIEDKKRYSKESKSIFIRPDSGGSCC